MQGTNTISRTVEGQTVYYMYNGHGDVTALLGANGQIAASYYYDAFGNIQEQTGSVSNPFKYANYFYDDETGVYYLNARYYDPKIARFLTEDTYTGEANDPLSLNLYTYCHNEPMMYTDPTGHRPSEGSTSSEEEKIQQKKKKDKDKEDKKKKEEAEKKKQDKEKKFKELVERLKKANPSEKKDIIKEVQKLYGIKEGEANKRVNDAIVSSSKATNVVDQGTGNTGTLDTVSGIAGVAATVKKVSTIVNKGGSLYINSVMKDGSLVNLLPFTKGTQQLTKQAEYSLNTLKAVRVSVPAAENMAEAMNVLSKVKTIAPVAGAAGKVVKVIAPVIEAPVSFENYGNLISENSSGFDNALVRTGAVGDAVSFGFARSVLKMPSLLELVPGDIPAWPDSKIEDYTDWVNKNINGIKAGDVLFGER